MAERDENNPHDRDAPVTRGVLTDALKEFAREVKADVADAMKGVERRFDGVDRRLDGIDERLDGVDQRLGGLERQVHKNTIVLEDMPNRLALSLEGYTTNRENIAEHDKRIKKLEDQVALVSVATQIALKPKAKRRR